MTRARALTMAALALSGLAFAVGHSCAVPRRTEEGTVSATSADGTLCAVGAKNISAVPGGFEFDGGGVCRFCPETVSVHFQSKQPEVSARWGLVGDKLVARHVQQTGCGGSACEYEMTAWWRAPGRWVVVRGHDRDSDDLGGGPPFLATWNTIAARCPSDSNP